MKRALCLIFLVAIGCGEKRKPTLEERAKPFEVALKKEGFAFTESGIKDNRWVGTGVAPRTSEGVRRAVYITFSPSGIVDIAIYTTSETSRKLGSADFDRDGSYCAQSKPVRKELTTDTEWGEVLFILASLRSAIIESQSPLN